MGSLVLVRGRCGASAMYTPATFRAQARRPLPIHRVASITAVRWASNAKNGDEANVGATKSGISSSNNGKDANATEPRRAAKAATGTRSGDSSENKAVNSPSAKAGDEAPINEFDKSEKQAAEGNKARGPVMATDTSQSDSASIPSRDPSATATWAANASQATTNTDTDRRSLWGDDWEAKDDVHIKRFDELPHVNFGVNQHMIINNDLKEVLRVLLRQFTAPIMYCFAYGSGVFPQGTGGRSVTDAEFRAVHPQPPEPLIRSQKGDPKMIDFIFGVTHTQHWHSINMKQHRDHYSSLASFGSGLVTRVQERYGAGVYFNPYVVVNGILIKYGVTSIDNLCHDLDTWDNLYLAGRLHKPVKILRDNPQVRLSNQKNLISAVRTALLLLPPDFTETELYSTITGISYLGDPRMAFPTENPAKVANIVENNMTMFRRLYGPLIDTLPNVTWNDPAAKSDIWLTNPETNLKITQDMDPVKRGNMVRRLPKAFRGRLYFQYQKKFGIPRDEFKKMMQESSEEDSGSFKRRQGGGFEQRVATDNSEDLRRMVRQVIKQTINWPSTTQSIKGVFTAGINRSIRYLREKWEKYQGGKKKLAAKAESDKKSS
jgi:mitochondrial translocator assembly and maintenance protein 41